MLQSRIALRNLFQQPDGILVVVCRAIEFRQNLLHLGLVARPRILLQVALHRLDILVIGGLVQFATQLGIVEQGIFLDFCIEVHLGGLEEHAPSLFLAIQPHIAVAKHIHGVLRHTVVAHRLSHQHFGGLDILTHLIVAVAYLIVVVLWRTALRLLLSGHLIHQTVFLQSFLIFSSVEINLAHHLVHFVSTESIFVFQEPRRQLQQLVFTAQIIIDTGNIARGNLAELRVVFQFLEVPQRRLIFSICILDMSIVIEARTAVL